MSNDQIKDKTAQELQREAAKQQKQDKRADALRANLKRRKEQARGPATDS